MTERDFTEEDQRRFAGLSGDWNPMHVDPVEARRTPYGQLVHGVHVVMWALEHYVAAAPTLPQRIRATFLQPVHLGARVSLFVERDGEEFVIAARGEGKTFVSVRVSGAPFVATTAAVPDQPGSVGEAKALAFADARGLEGRLELGVAAAEMSAEFPNLTRVLGTMRAAALLALSRLVGMECPGLHSVFAAFDLSMNAAAAPTLSYRVTRHSSPAAPIRLAVSGGGLDGTVDAFFRPAPVEQASAAETRSLVRAGEFADQTVLVIGGSRGLGEASAKLIAAGGGLVILTYRVGSSDAARVAADIAANGGRCRVASLDVLGSLDDAPGVWEPDCITQVLYFASPAIRGNRSASFDRALFDTYVAYYVDGFARLCRALPAGNTIRVFFPSTVFLDDGPAGFLEYVAAKAAGEAVAAGLARECPSLSFVVERLPRTRTDQTSSLLDHGGVAAHEVMLPILRRMSSEKEHQ